VNKASAPIYGLDPAQYTDTLTKVTLDPAQRPGFMTRVGFLSSFAHPDSTSPILRGAYITINFIGVNPGAPDPNARNVSITDNFPTEREYVTALTSSQSTCQGCHVPYVNPPGFNLEHYDSIGKWQDTDPRGGTIDSTADVHFTSDGPTQQIHSAQELMTQIAQTPAALAAYAQQWVAFATGRNPNPGDQCIADQLNTKLSADGYSVLALLGDLTQADSFRLRVKETP
jgi:hypothetical protein